MPKWLWTRRPIADTLRTARGPRCWSRCVVPLPVECGTPTRPMSALAGSSSCSHRNRVGIPYKDPVHQALLVVELGHDRTLDQLAPTDQLDGLRRRRSLRHRRCHRSSHPRTTTLHEEPTAGNRDADDAHPDIDAHPTDLGCRIDESSRATVGRPDTRRRRPQAAHRGAACPCDRPTPEEAEPEVPQRFVEEGRVERLDPAVTGRGRHIRVDLDRPRKITRTAEAPG